MMNPYEWFDLIAISRNDQEIVHHLLNNLKGYRGARPSNDDIVQVVNFLGAVRMHQLRDGKLK